MQKYEILCRFILNNRYHLKLNDYKRSIWRKRTATAFMAWKHNHPEFTADDFVSCWEGLKKKGLLE